MARKGEKSEERSRRKLIPRGPPRRQGRLRALVLGLALAAMGAGIFLWRALSRQVVVEVSPLDNPPAPLPLDRISWPAIPPQARPSFQRAMLSLQEGLALYDRQDPKGADERILGGLALLERSDALVAQLAGYHYQTVVSAYQQNDLAEAEKRAQHWLAKFPQDQNHLMLLAVTQYKQGRWADAMRNMQEIARLSPDSVEARRWLGEICFHLGAREEGVGAVREALKLMGFPDQEYWRHPLAEKVLRNGYMVLHRFQEYELLAEVARAHRLRFAPQMNLVPEAAREEGVALVHLGRCEEAEPLLKVALTKTQNRDEILFVLALAQAKQNRWRDAARGFASLLEEYPHYARGYYQLGLCLSRLGKAEQAEIMFRRARELAPSDRENLRETQLRGAGSPGQAAVAQTRAYVLQGRFTEAERALRAKELRDDPYPVFALAEFYLDCLRALDALRVLEHAVKLVGAEHPDVAGTRARALFTQGEEARALVELEALAGRKESPAAWRLQLAKQLLDAGRFADSIRALERMEAGGGASEDSFVFGRALLLSGDPGRALDKLRLVSRGDTRWEAWEGNAWLARALVEAGRDPEQDSREAEGLLAEVPRASRHTRAYLTARLALLSRPGRAEAGAAELETTRQELQRHGALDGTITSARREVARTPWPDSGPLYLKLARLHASRGEVPEAVRLARIALAAQPGSPETLRALADWFSEPGDVFYRLRALKDLLARVPGDTAAAGQLKALEAEWMDF